MDRLGKISLEMKTPAALHLNGENKKNSKMINHSIVHLVKYQALRCNLRTFNLF